MSEQQQQQQQQQQQAPAIDYGALYGTLSAENKDVYTRKGFDKAGADGKPIDINGVFDWARNAERLVGVDHIPSPRLDDDKAFNEWAGWSKLGVPKEGKDYKLDRAVLNMPEGAPYDEAGENVLRVAMRKANIGQKQADIIFRELGAHRVGEMTKAMTAAKDAKTAMETDLRNSYGQNYEGNMQRANMAIRYAAEQAGIIAAGDTADQVKAKLGQAVDGLSAALGNANAVKLMVWFGQQLGEDAIKGGRDAGFSTGKDGAKAEMASLRLNKEFMAAYHDKRHAGHADAVARMNRLSEQAEG